MKIRHIHLALKIHAFIEEKSRVSWSQINTLYGSIIADTRNRRNITDRLPVFVLHRCDLRRFPCFQIHPGKVSCIASVEYTHHRRSRLPVFVRNKSIDLLHSHSLREFHLQSFFLSTIFAVYVQLHFFIGCLQIICRIRAVDLSTYIFCRRIAHQHIRIRLFHLECETGRIKPGIIFRNCGVFCFGCFPTGCRHAGNKKHAKRSGNDT